MIYDEFVSQNKSCVIAPAGYGKTYTICKCVELSTQKQLILTHTNAGVASIKAKLQKNSIPSSKYHLETIAGYCEKYVKSYGEKDLTPAHEKGSFKDLYENATKIISNSIIQKVIKSTYEGVYVDEYQDCSLRQHYFVVELSKIIKVHILGDPLQAIFDLDITDPLINWERELTEFGHPFSLETPQRWMQSECSEVLGTGLKTIRECLMNNIPIEISKCDFINHWKSTMDEIRLMTGDLYTKLWKLAKEKSMLIVFYDASNKFGRFNISKKFPWLNNIEAFDAKEYYDFAKDIDTCNSANYYDFFYNKIRCFFKVEDFNNYFINTRLKNKKNQKDQQQTENIRKIKEELDNNFNKQGFYNFLRALNIDLKITCYNKNFFKDILSSLENSIAHKNTVYEAMKEIKYKQKLVGRKVEGKYIGTTLLTKGLEFDTVVILGADKMDVNNLYVAMTRACKKLILVSESDVLMPWQNGTSLLRHKKITKETKKIESPQMDFDF